MLDALARLHAHWWSHPKIGEEVGNLPTTTSIEEEFQELRDAFPGWENYRFHAIENLFIPFWAWLDRGAHWGFHRWHQLEKAMLAFEDLDCKAFLA